MCLSSIVNTVKLLLQLHRSTTTNKNYYKPKAQGLIASTNELKIYLHVEMLSMQLHATTEVNH